MKKMLRSAITGIALLVAGQHAGAAIQYSGLKDIPIPLGSDGVAINMVKDAHVNDHFPLFPFSGEDISFHNPFGILPLAVGVYSPLDFKGGVIYQLEGSTTDGVNNVGPGFVVGPDRSAPLTGAMPYINVPRNSPRGVTDPSLKYGIALNSQDNYFGLYLYKEDTQTFHYGWVRVALGATERDPVRRVVDWAWEDTPDTPITTGDCGGSCAGSSGSVVAGPQCNLVAANNPSLSSLTLGTAANPGVDCTTFTISTLSGDAPNVLRIDQKIDVLGPQWAPFHTLTFEGPANAPTGGAPLTLAGDDSALLSSPIIRMQELNLTNASVFNDGNVGFVPLYNYNAPTYSITMRNSTLRLPEQTDLFGAGSQNGELLVPANSGTSVLSDLIGRIYSPFSISVESGATLKFFRNGTPSRGGVADTNDVLYFSGVGSSAVADGGRLHLSGSYLWFKDSNANVKAINGGEVLLTGEGDTVFSGSRPSVLDVSFLSAETAGVINVWGGSAVKAKTLILGDGTQFNMGDRIGALDNLSAFASIEVLRTLGAGDTASIWLDTRRSSAFRQTAGLQVTRDIALLDGGTINVTGKGEFYFAGIQGSNGAELNIGGDVLAYSQDDIVVQNITLALSGSGELTLGNHKTLLVANQESAANRLNIGDDAKLNIDIDGELQANGTIGTFGTGSPQITVGLWGALTVDDQISATQRGTLTVEGNLEFRDFAEFRYTLDPVRDAGGPPKLTVNGRFALGSTLVGAPVSLMTPTLVADQLVALGTRYTLVDYDPALSANPGAFSGYRNGSIFQLGLNWYQINYQDVSTIAANRSAITLTAVAAPAAFLSVAVTPPTIVSIQAGDVITFSSAITNGGNAATGLLNFTDSFGSSTFSCTKTPQPFSLSPSETVTCDVDYNVTQADIDRDKIGYVFSATDNVLQVDGNTSVGPLRNPSLAVMGVTNDLLATANAGDTVNYTFTVSNSGNATLYDAILFGEVDGDSGRTVGAGCVPDYPIPTLAPGQSFSCSGTLSLSAYDINNGALDTTWRARAPNPPGANVEGQAQQSSAVTQTPAVSVTVTSKLDFGADNQAAVGDKIRYAFVVTNDGNIQLNNLTLTDSNLGVILDCGVSPIPFLEASHSLNCTGEYTLVSGDIGGSVSGQVTVSGVPGLPAQPAGPAVNSGAAHSTAVPANPAVTGIGSGAISAGANGQIDTGDAVTFTFTVSNSGNETVQGLTVSNGVLGAASCDKTTLLPGESATCQATAAVAQGHIDAGSVDVTFEARGTTVDGGVHADIAISLPVTRTTTLSFTKAGIGDFGANGQADVGDTLYYTLIVENTGNEALTSPIVSDPVLANLSCPTEDIAPGAILSCTGSYVVTAQDVAAGQFDNRATASATGASSGQALSPVEALFSIVFPAVAAAVPIHPAWLMLALGLMLIVARSRLTSRRA